MSYAATLFVLGLCIGVIVGAFMVIAALRD